MDDRPHAGVFVRHRRTIGVLLAMYWIAMVTSTHWPLPVGLFPGQTDKLLHVGAFTVLGLMFGLWRVAGGAALERLRPWLAHWGVLLAYAAFDELTQPLFGRSADVRDWLMDALGGAVGLGVISLVRRYRPAWFTPDPLS